MIFFQLFLYLLLRPPFPASLGLSQPTGKKAKHQQNRKWFQEQLQHHTQHLAVYPSFIRRHLRHLLLLMLNNLPKNLGLPSPSPSSLPPLSPPFADYYSCPRIHLLCFIASLLATCRFNPHLSYDRPLQTLLQPTVKLRPRRSTALG